MRTLRTLCTLCTTLGRVVHLCAPVDSYQLLSYFNATNSTNGVLHVTTQQTVSVAEAAHRLGGTSHDWVRQLVRAGRLKAYRPLPRKTRIVLSSLEALINENNSNK